MKLRSPVHQTERFPSKLRYPFAGVRIPSTNTFFTTHQTLASGL